MSILALGRKQKKRKIPNQRVGESKKKERKFPIKEWEKAKKKERNGSVGESFHRQGGKEERKEERLEGKGGC